MSIPVTKSLYCSTASFPGTTFGGLSETRPPSVATTWGWNVGQDNPPLFCEMNWNIEVVRTSTQWQAAPTQSAPNQNSSGSGAGNGWMAGPYNGEFLAGNWQITMSVKQVTDNYAHQGQFIYRIWTSPTGSGANATLVTSSFISSSLINMPTTTTIVSSGSVSVALPKINLHNEYIFFQTYWSIITAATNNNADNDFVLGSTGSVIISPPFVANKTSIIAWPSHNS